MVRVKEAVVITPSEPTPNTILQLSALDSQLFLRFTIEYLLVYRPAPGMDRASTTARLKAALAKALVPYYPFAGRVRARSEGPGLEVLCRAQGAVFIEASSDRYTVNDFHKAPKTVTQWRSLLSLYVTDVLKGSPVLVFQLTWLADGAAAVGVGINHCICDGIGSAEFLNHLSDLASGKRDLKPKAVWDRHLLNQNGTRANPARHPEFARVPDLCGFMNRVTSGLKPTCIVLDERRIEALKSACGGGTSFEVVAAHVWRSWARALGFPRNQTVKLLFSVNVRKRVKPGLPEGYYGNAFVLGCAQSSAWELGERGVGFGWGLVKRAKERVDSEHVRSVVELVSESRASPEPVGVLILSQWSRLGLESVEMGMGMGKAVHVGPICSDRYCLFLPVTAERHSVKVVLAVPSLAVYNFHRFLRQSHS
ncbi:taxadien-5-alpha-ol O-acetyltransferase [Cajanus cajan]|uniref:Taxadien-5-alpha-ol O-acetyltransferase n=1 Tax=Cajanus cajan TaxID=3821 RepID=A0A151SNT7_CAJCA|nr:taxadien-5-alpha-ol O-acetyltransferase [Cajanus cajan]KYP56494.1 Taxadien-5-alpha-ol O-acetyltransferase [Cajanus cajan]